MEYDYREYRKDSQAVLGRRTAAEKRWITFCPPRDEKRKDGNRKKSWKSGILTERLKSDFRKQQRKRTGKMFRKLRKNWQSYRAQLLEEQRTVGKLSTVKNQYLDQLKENELHKQREKERFIQSVDKILKNRSEELRAEKRVHNGSLEEYLKKVWKNVLTKDAEKDGDIENNGEKEGFV